jgi:hypothetical protein
MSAYLVPAGGSQRTTSSASTWAAGHNKIEDFHTCFPVNSRANKANSVAA